MKKIRKPIKASLLKRKKQAKDFNNYFKNTIPLNIPFTLNLDLNLQELKKIFTNCNDVIFREFVVGESYKVNAAVVYIDGLCDTSIINENMLKPLLIEVKSLEAHGQLSSSVTLNKVKNALLTIGDVKETNNIQQLLNQVLSGDVAILLDGFADVLLASARKWEHRNVDEPVSETVVRGPREGFVETLRTNTSLIRRKIKSPDLKLEMIELGKTTKTNIGIVYLKNICSDKLVVEVKRRLSLINLDGILESGYIEELIEDNRYSPFSQVNRTERPDKVAANLLEGKVAIIIDGSPFVLTVPTVFIEFLQSSEDYYERYYVASAVRIIRLLALLISLLAPSIFIAITSFHHQMLPTALLISIAGQREGVPFPVLVEALLMEVSFELMREAGVRLPRQVGQAVSIVGALVIGQAAVEAGLVSPAMVIVVAVTGIASFAVSGYAASITFRLLRFPIMLLSASLGLFGIMAGIIAIITHMVNLRSFGVPYLSPMGPLIIKDLKDTSIRKPWWSNFRRPSFSELKDPIRQSFSLEEDHNNKT